MDVFVGGNPACQNRSYSTYATLQEKSRVYRVHEDAVSTYLISLVPLHDLVAYDTKSEEHCGLFWVTESDVKHVPTA